MVSKLALVNKETLTEKTCREVASCIQTGGAIEHKKQYSYYIML